MTKEFGGVPRPRRTPSNTGYFLTGGSIDGVSLPPNVTPTQVSLPGANATAEFQFLWDMLADEYIQ